MLDQYSRRGFRQNPLLLPNGVKLLLIINISVFILMELSGQKNILFQMFGLIPYSVLQEYKLWQMFTYLFIITIADRHKPRAAPGKYCRMIWSLICFRNTYDRVTLLTS